ncbi:hypothetical protein ACCT03_37025, partial [Rhizobium johnstonii]|uniref:hypothetical protein n=1 Tax=Rhizobium johnstonii TaxID=3019933 RepID=UPI003F94E754
DGGGIIEAEIHLAKRPKLFRQTEPALSQRSIEKSFTGCQLSYLQRTLGRRSTITSNPRSN